MEDIIENTEGSSVSPEEEFKRGLKKAFDRMDREIKLILFTERGKDDVFVQATREIIGIFRTLTDKITFREYSLDHKMAKKYKIKTAPVLLIHPEVYNIRWMGAPMGEEVRTLLEALLLVGSGNSWLGDQARNVIRKIDSPRNVKVFVSVTCPYCPQQAVNAVKAVVEKPDLISLEIIDVQSRQDLAVEYGAQGVPQTFANDLLIGQGAQSEEVFADSLRKLEPQTIFIPEITADLVEVDIVIVGGGPAGLTSGIYAVRSGLKAAIVERGALGGQVATTPVVENYPGFTQVGGKTLVDIMVSHALQYVPIFQGEEVVTINPGEPMEVLTSRRKFRTKTVLLATGASHRSLGVPGEKRLSGRGVSYCSTCDGPLFKGKSVMMIGGGDSAVTEALHLYHMGVKVTLVHRQEKLRAQEFLTRNLLESGIPVLWNSEVRDILGETRVEGLSLYNNKTRKTSKIPADGVFISIGYAPAVELALKIGVKLTPDGYIQRDERHRTSIAGIYSAGDVEGGYKQIVTAAGQGAEAALAIFEDLINPYWLKQKN
ncbi:MAG: thioredoxin reductase [Thermodesulfobacteriota bacterium]|nr:thioredoxin reductase [Thermodesulfobacteriota bacterium]